MKYITKGEPILDSLLYKVDLTDDIVTILERTLTAGDYVLYDKINQELICVDFSVDLSNYPSESYTPVGIVVIPTSHDVYGDGSCGIMSLKVMNCDTPDEGIIYESSGACWGGNEDNISLPNLTLAPIIGTGSNVGDISSTVTGEGQYAYLPSDKFNTIQCPHDTDTYYYSSSSSYMQAPSPYLTNGSRNPAYYQTTSPSSPENALADFDGIENSQILWDLATAQSDWKIASSITNTADSGYYPAACCCWRYHTEGTSQGDWYLPAMGELGYIMPPFNKINEAIGNILTIYGSSVGVKLSTRFYYWSSTEYSSDYARTV